MSIIVRINRVSPKQPAEFWVDQCIEAGTKDQYGQTFRVIKLFWVNTANHKMAPYVKTKGFEDAEIFQDNGSFAVNYRKNGSLFWQQSATGIGPYFAECPVTPHNMRKLASHFGDKLWTYSKNDKDVEAVVQKMHEKQYVNVPEAIKKFNEARIRAMHTNVHDNVALTTSTEENSSILQSIKETERANTLKAEELNRKEMDLKVEREKINNMKAALVDDDVAISQYSEEYLQSIKKIVQLRKIARSIGAVWNNNMTMETLRTVIMKKQTGNEELETPNSQIEDSLEA